VVYKILDRFRYSYAGSRLLVFFAVPILNLSKFITAQAYKKLKFNGASIDYYGTRIRFPKNVGMGILSSIKLKGENGFEPNTSKALIEFAKNSDVFIDIGSNFGFYSVLLKLNNPKLRVYSIEPINELVNANLKFHEANMLEANVLCSALSDQDGEMQINIPTSSSPKELLTATLEKNFFYNKKFTLKERKIAVDTLDRFSKKSFTLHDRHFLIKVDVEGHELNVLKGAVQFITERKPWIICEIDHASNKKVQLIEYMKGLEYFPLAITSHGLINLEWSEFEEVCFVNDFLFSPNRLLANTNIVPFEKVADLSRKLHNT
jgi:FkbM family methyltransferase